MGYNTIDELEALGINAKALSGFTEEQKQLASDAADAEVDSYLAGRMGVPLTAPVPLSIKVHAARIAVFNLMSVRGMDPEADRLIIDNYNRAIAFLTQVSKGVVTLGPAVTPPADDPTDDLDGPFMYSDPERGWSRGWV